MDSLHNPTLTPPMPYAKSKTPAAPIGFH